MAGQLPYLRRIAMRTLYDMLGTPVAMRRVNGWLTVFWIVMIPISLALGWLDSVTYVSMLSLWALVSGHWAAWQAARVECRQADDAEVAQVLDELDHIRQRLTMLNQPPRRDAS